MSCYLIPRNKKIFRKFVGIIAADWDYGEQHSDFLASINDDNKIVNIQTNILNNLISLNIGIDTCNLRSRSNFVKKSYEVKSLLILLIFSEMLPMISK